MIQHHVPLPRLWPGPRLRWPAGLTAHRLVLGAVIVLFLYLTVVPLAMLLWGSFRTDAPGAPHAAYTLQNYARAYGHAFFYQLVGNTAAYSLGTTALALGVGFALAWIVERTDIPLRGPIFFLSIVRLAVPNMMMVIAWILLLSPRMGVVNGWAGSLLHLGRPLFNIYSLWGMIWVEGVDKVPIAFLLASGALRAMDPTLEESACVSGAGLWRTVRRVTLPLIFPAMLAAGLLVFLMAFESFEAPTLIGLPFGIRTLVSEIYVRTRGVPPDIPLASAFGVLFLALAVAGILLQQRAVRAAEKFTTITGKGFRAGRIELGRWRLPVAGATMVFLLWAYVLPIAILLWASLLPFYQAPSLRALHRVGLGNYREVLILHTPVLALRNSVILGVGGATVIALLSLIMQQALTRRRTVAVRLVDLLVFTPIVTPGIVLAISLIWVYIRMPLPVYGTLWILLIAYVTRYSPFGMRFAQAAFMQLHRELEEAVDVSSGSWWYGFRRVTVPLVIPALFGGWAYLLVYCFRDAATSIMLYTTGTETTSVVVFNLWNNGEIGPAAALAVIVLVILGAAVALARRLVGRYHLERMA